MPRNSSSRSIRRSFEFPIASIKVFSQLLTRLSALRIRWLRFTRDRPNR
jgi:hypothetical protein